MKDIRIPLKRKWYEQIVAGTKREEYRLYNDYWRKRLEGRTYRNIIFTLGYPKADDESRHHVVPWRGYVLKTITSEEWNNEPKSVFAILTQPKQRDMFPI